MDFWVGGKERRTGQMCKDVGNLWFVKVEVHDFQDDEELLLDCVIAACQAHCSFQASPVDYHMDYNWLYDIQVTHTF